MSTPYPSLEMSNGNDNQALDEQITANVNAEEEEALIDDSQEQVRSPNCHYQPPVTMSPRIPRKRIVPNNTNANYSKEVLT